MQKSIDYAYLSADVREVEKSYQDPKTKLCYGLMERAGLTLYEIIKEKALSMGWTKIAIICGSGNNGGDGYEAAYHLKQANFFEVICYTPKLPKEGTEAYVAYQKYSSLDGEIIQNIEEFKSQEFQIIVDGLLGIGLNSAVRSDVVPWIKAINQSSAYKIAIDVPSGLNADAGIVEGVAVKCDITVTFILPKVGLFMGEARDYVGEINYHDLDVDLSKFNLTQRISIITYEKIKDKLPKRQRAGNKSNSGKLLLVGGHANMPGAIRIAAKGALRSGVGLIKVASCAQNLPIIASDCPEFMLHNLDETDQAILFELKGWADACVIGPGLGRTSWSNQIWNEFKDFVKPLVIDADGLFFLSQKPSPNRHSIITPHDQEASRLLNIELNELQRDRIQAIKKLQAITQGVVVLKGAGTLIYDGKDLYLMDEGCEGMSVGGMGDLLTGIIGALLAFGLSLIDATLIAVAVHGRAAKIDSKNGMIGMLPSDLLPYIRKLINNIEI